MTHSFLDGVVEDRQQGRISREEVVCIVFEYASNTPEEAPHILLQLESHADTEFHYIAQSVRQLLEHGHSP